MINDKFLPVVL